MKDLKSVCMASIGDLRKLGKFTQTYGKSGYTFIDNGARILAVAHIDTVARGKPNWISVAGTYFSIQFDDRLGVHMLLNVLPALGMEYDILLTEDEEIGWSTAYDFATDKKYNWIFEVDRRDVGECALYQFYNDQNVAKVKSAGFKPVYGSFSDICYLDMLGVAAFNFSAGYYNEHTELCRTSDVDIWVASQMILEFYNIFKDDVIPYTRVAKKVSKTTTTTTVKAKPYAGIYDKKYDTLSDDEWDEMFQLAKYDIEAATDYNARFLFDDTKICDFCGGNDALDYGIAYTLCPTCYDSIWGGV